MLQFIDVNWLNLGLLAIVWFVIAALHAWVSVIIMPDDGGGKGWYVVRHILIIIPFWVCFIGFLIGAIIHIARYANHS